MVWDKRVRSLISRVEISRLVRKTYGCVMSILALIYFNVKFIYDKEIILEKSQAVLLLTTPCLGVVL